MQCTLFLTALMVAAIPIAQPATEAKAADSLPSGIYRRNLEGPGTKVDENDGFGHALLRRPASTGFGAASMYSVANDNARFRLDLTGAGPVPEGADRGHLAVVVGGQCLPVEGHSDSAADGTINLGMTVVGEDAAKRMTKDLTVEPRLSKASSPPVTGSFWSRKEEICPRRAGNTGNDHKERRRSTCFLHRRRYAAGCRTISSAPRPFSAV